MSTGFVIHLYNGLVIKKGGRIKKKLYGFELWVCRKILRMSWTKKESHKKMQKVRPNIWLQAMKKYLEIRNFVHVMNAHQALKKDIMLEIAAGQEKNK